MPKNDAQSNKIKNKYKITPEFNQWLNHPRAIFTKTTQISHYFP